VLTEDYVVRIYRRGQGGKQSVVGVVEAVQTGWQKPFRSLRELKEILARPSDGLAGPVSQDSDSRGPSA
jgi:hypothetical protein